MTDIRSKNQRGTCSVCGYSQPRLRNGLIGAHSLYSGHEKFVCTGSHRPDKWQALAVANSMGNKEK